MPPETCEKHSDHEIRISLVENKVDNHSERLNKHGSEAREDRMSVSLAKRDMQFLINKVDDLIVKCDSLIKESAVLNSRVDGHLNESGFWRGFMCTVAFMLVLQLGMFIYAWGVINSTVKENYKNIENNKKMIEKGISRLMSYKNEIN